MAFDPERHHRRSVRLRGYDYAQAGAYYVTVCVEQRECLLGDVVDGQMVVNESGLIVSEFWEQVAEHWPAVVIDAFVVMPNHFHGIIVLGAGDDAPEGAKGEEGGVPPLLQDTPATDGPTLGAVVAYWKYQTSKRINEMRQSSGTRLWQRSFHDRVIRNEQMLGKARLYIANNPARWVEDVNNLANVTTS